MIDQNYTSEFSHYSMEMATNRNYTLDGARLRNISSMFNHQCLDENLYLARVQCYHRDKEIWRMCFFAKKNIKPNTELTFNYFHGDGSQKNRESFFDGICKCLPCKTKRDILNNGKKK